MKPDAHKVRSASTDRGEDRFRLHGLASHLRRAAALFCLLAAAGARAQPAITSVTGGYYHSLVVRSDGGLWTMGGNYAGQLCDGTTNNRSRPGLVLSGISAASGGFGYSLILKSDGALWAAGDNYYGQLGDGTMVSRTNPVQVATGVVAVSAGSYHSLYLKANGTLWAVGLNDYGQLGDGTYVRRTNAVAIATDVKAVAAGGQHSLFLKTDGSLWATGSNITGQLGDGTFNNRPSPVQVAQDVAAIDAGSDHSVFLKTDGSLWAMGSNSSGQLADGTAVNHNLPQQIVTGVEAVSAGAFHTLWIKIGGDLWAAGNNAAGQLGDGSTVFRSTPVLVATGAAKVSTGYEHSLFVKSDGSLWGMGRNYEGQLGDGTNSTRYTPVPIVLGLPAVITPPSTQVAVRGGNVAFSAAATGVPAPTYQWRFGGVAIGGATTSTLMLSNVQPAQAGAYDVVVANNLGAVTSAPASLIVTIAGAPANDNFAAAQALPGNSGTVEGTTTGATGETGEPLHFSTEGAASSIWYSWTPSVSGSAILTAGGSAIDAVLAVYTGSTLTTLTRITQDDDSAGNLASKVVFSVTAGITYRIAVGSGTAIRGQVVLSYNASAVPGGIVVGWGNNHPEATSVPANLYGVVAIAAGSSHVLALKSDGTVVAWGWSAFQQTWVPYGLSDVTAVAAGDYHSLALKRNGTVVAWGSNDYGESTVPSGLSGVTAISAGGSHTLALKSDGTVVAWGSNSFGESTVPTGLSGIVAIAAGMSHNLCLKSNGTVVEWGRNWEGQASVPSGLSGVVAIDAGDFQSLALKSDGTVVEWGSTGNTVPAGLSDVRAISAGWHNMALKRDGTIVTWRGTNNWGELTVPAGLEGPIAIAAGSGYSLALVNSVHPLMPVISSQPISQTVSASGRIDFGVVATSAFALNYQWKKNGVKISGATTATHTLYGVRSSDAASYTVVVSNSTGSVTSAAATLTVIGAREPLAAVGAGSYHTLFIEKSGRMTAAGFNDDGQLGDGTTLSRPSPVVVANGVSFATGGYGHTLFLDGNATLWGVGANSYGELGNGANNQHQPLPIQIATNVAAAAAKFGISFFVKTDGTLWGMGNNYSGAIGDLTYSPRTRPVQVASDVVDVRAGSGFTLFLKSDHTLWGMGVGSGWLGERSGSGNAGPSQFASDVISFAAGNDHSVYVTSDGAAWTVGWNLYGALGDGTTTSRKYAMPVITDVKAVAAGSAHTLFLKNDGSLWGCGWNYLGELGDGTTTQRNTPVQIATGVASVHAGDSHSLFFKTDGSLWGMGGSAYGQLGDGSTGNRITPVLLAAGPIAPTIAIQPASQAISTGQSVLFSVTATGTAPLRYQWRKNALNLSGATAMTYNISNAQLADAGAYSVIVSNDVGSVVSNVATLTVTPGPLITAQPATRQIVNAGQNLTLTIGATGTGALSYQWKRNGRSIAGATGANYTIAAASGRDSGWYQPFVTDSTGTSAGQVVFVNVAAEPAQIVGWGLYTAPGDAVLSSLSRVQAIAANTYFALALRGDGTVAAWGENSSGQSSVPAGLTDVVAMAAGGFHAAALKSNGTVVAWGSNSDGQTDVPNALSGVVAVAAGGSHTLALRSDGTTVGWGSSFHGQTESRSGVIAIAAGWNHNLAAKTDGTVIAWGNNYYGQTTVPTGLSGVVAVAAGANHSLALKSDGTVVAWGNNYNGELSVPAGLGQVMAVSGGGWHSAALKENGAVVGWGDNSLGQSTVPANLGQTLAIATGANFTVALVGPSAPVIVTQPVAKTIIQGAPVTFGISANGTAPLSYQWRKNGNVISGASAATYTIASVQTTDSGSYDVVVSNSMGSATSAAAGLTVMVAPSITTQPAPVTVTAGVNASFIVAATGTPSPIFQWRKDGVPLTGATAPTLILTNVQPADAGNYAVSVSNPAASVVSTAVTLTVNAAGTTAVILTQPVNQLVRAGQTATFAVVGGGAGPLAYQWRKDGVDLAGATDATLQLTGVQPSQAGAYAVAVINGTSTATSRSAILSVIPAGFTGTHAVVGAGYFAGGTAQITTTITPSGTLTGLGYQVLLPAGLSYVAGGGAEGDVRPVAGAVDLLEWRWSTVPAGAITFTYTLAVARNLTTTQSLAGMITALPGPVLLLAQPDPLLIAPVVSHDADTDRNLRISLLELTRVIELFNTRNGTVRTGRYLVQSGTEDGFNADPQTAANGAGTLSRYHSGDSNHDGAIGVYELTRVIELFNYRSGTSRTGQYHAQSNTEDGFAPGP